MLKTLRQFARARQGLAAVEFALIAPVMIMMFYGAIELTSAADCNGRVSRMAATAADLVAQSTSVSTSDTTNIFNAAYAILYPYPSAPAKIVISSLVDNGHGATTVSWSDATSNTTPRAKNTTVTIPSGLITSGSGNSLILAEITYTYTAPLTYFTGGTLTLTQSFYSRPRRSVVVAHS